MKNLFCIVVLVLLLGCARNVVPSVDYQQMDSTSVSEKITFKDTCVDTPGDSVRAELKIKNPEIKTPVTITSKSKQANITLHADSNGVSAKCNCDPVEVKLKNTYLSMVYYRQLSQKRSEVKTVEVPFIPWWAKILSWAGGILTPLTVLYIIFKLKL